MAGFSLMPSGRGHNYTGMLTRSIVFSAALLAFLTATGLTLASIIVPNWISFETTTNYGARLHETWGLHKRCSNTGSHTPPPVGITSSMHCTHFPKDRDCEAGDRYFCSMWRSVAFLMSFAVVIEGMAIAAFAILLAGGKQKREQGWGVLTILVALAGLIQAIGMALIAYLFENEDQFFEGWFLDKSWTMCTVSWVLQALCATAITVAALVLPSEGGYELIPDSA